MKPLVCIVAGAPLALAYEPFGFAFLAPLLLAVLFAVWLDDGPREAFVHGLLFGLASFMAGLYWIHISIHEFGQAPVVLSLALMFGLVLVLALFVAVAGFLSQRFFAGRHTLNLLLAMPALWVLTEWTRNWIFTGFGWLSVGYSQTDTWLMGLAPVLGLHGMSYAVALTGGAIAALVLGSARERKAAAIALVAVWAVGWLAHGQRWTEPKGNFVNVAIVQGAVSQDVKWMPEQYPVTLDLYRDLTFSTAGRDLVIWPEVAVPNLYANARGYLDQVQAEAERRGMAVMLGILRADPDSAGPQNALVTLTGEREFYIKRHLVPFGEYFPVPQFVREWLRLMSLPYSDLSPGAADQPPMQIAGERVAVTICYEDVFGFEQLHSMPEASLLVNVSNDAWFGRSIALNQHLQITRLRAAEVGRYLLRATNTGISAIIDPDGQVVREAEKFVPAVINETVQGFTGSTPYAIWGNLPVVLVAFVVLAIQLPTTKLTMRPRT